MFHLLFKSVSHSELVAIFQATVLYSDGVDHRVTIEPVLASVGWDKLWVWAVPEINSRDIFWNGSDNFFLLNFVRFILILHRGVISHQIRVSSGVLIKDPIDQKHRRLMEDPLESVDKHVKLVLERQTEEVLEVLEEVFVKLLVELGGQLAEFIVFGLLKHLGDLVGVVVVLARLSLGNEGLKPLAVLLQQLLSPLLIRLVVLGFPLLEGLLVLGVVESPSLFVQELVHLNQVVSVLSLGFVVSLLGL